MGSLVLAAGTAIGAAVGARGPSRVRSKLDSEISSWSQLPEGTEQRKALWLLVCRSVARLVELEDPERRRRRKAYVIFGAFASLVLTANAAWSYWRDGTAAATKATLGLALYLAFLLAQDWYKRRQRLRAAAEESVGPEETAERDVN